MTLASRKRARAASEQREHTIPCEECRTETRPVFLRSAVGLAPLAGKRVCPDCIDRFERERSDAIKADAHDDPTCTCGACTRVRAREEAAKRAQDARTHGGLAPLAFQLLGDLDL